LSSSVKTGHFNWNWTEMGLMLTLPKISWTSSPIRSSNKCGKLSLVKSFNFILDHRIDIFESLIFISTRRDSVLYLLYCSVQTGYFNWNWTEMGLILTLPKISSSSSPIQNSTKCGKKSLVKSFNLILDLRINIFDSLIFI
jgi:hypothetical protein